MTVAESDGSVGLETVVVVVIVSVLVLVGGVASMVLGMLCCRRQKECEGGDADKELSPQKQPWYLKPTPPQQTESQQQNAFLRPSPSVTTFQPQSYQNQYQGERQYQGETQQLPVSLEHEEPETEEYCQEELELEQQVLEYPPHHPYHHQREVQPAHHQTDSVQPLDPHPHPHHPYHTPHPHDGHYFPYQELHMQHMQYMQPLHHLQHTQQQQQQQEGKEPDIVGGDRLRTIVSEENFKNTRHYVPRPGSRVLRISTTGEEVDDYIKMTPAATPASQTLPLSSRRQMPDFSEFCKSYDGGSLGILEDDL